MGRALRSRRWLEGAGAERGLAQRPASLGRRKTPESARAAATGSRWRLVKALVREARILNAGGLEYPLGALYQTGQSRTISDPGANEMSHPV